MAEPNGVLTNTMQSQVQGDEYAGLDILPMFLQASGILPAWWSKARDIELARFWPRIDHVASAFSMFASKTTSIPVRIVPRDSSIKAHVKQADYYNSIIIEGADFGNGWHASLGPKFIIDFISQDNGGFIEIIGDAPMVRDRVTQKLRKDYSKPIQGPVLGFAHLDSQKCQRTSNPEFPVIYEATDGSRYKLHHTRVMFASSLPSARARMNAVGYSALSRMINTAQHLLDLATSEQEELGSRPKRRLVIGKQGVTAGEIVAAFNMADVQMDNEGLSRYSKSVVIAPKEKRTSNNPIEIDIKDLSLAMTGDIKQTSITLGMFLIALALNIPPRWLWPATSTGATKADAMFQHVAGMGGGIGHLLMVFKQMLGGDTLATAFGKPIPSHLDVIFDYQDDEQDRQQADIREVRSKVYTANLASSIWDTRVARLQAAEVGDITEQHFDDMELADGRLPDGQDVLNLFYSSDPVMQDMLALSVGDVLNPNDNEAEVVLEAVADKELEVRALLQNPPRPKMFDAAKQAWAALQALRRLYEDKQAKEQMELQMQQGLQGEPELDEEGKPIKDKVEEEDKPQPAEEEKPQPPLPAPVKTKESTWLAIVDKLLPVRKEQAPAPQPNNINVSLPAINITMPAIQNDVMMPDHPAIYNEISVPEQTAPYIENRIIVPQQQAPVVHVKQADAPVFQPQINITPQEVNVHIPDLPAPVVNINPELHATLDVPPIEEEIIDVQRDGSGFITRAKKTRKRGK